jgi:hypothetical protein
VIRAWRQLKTTAASIPAKRGHLAKDDRRIGTVDGGGNWQLSFVPKNCLNQLALVEMQLDAVVVDNDAAYRGPQQLSGELGRADNSLKTLQALFYIERRRRRRDQKIEQLLGRSQESS